MATSKRSLQINREPMSAQVARLIRADILNGEYKLGARLVETDLAERYGIGRHIIREALQVLEGEQLVVSDAFRGRTVIQPSKEDIEGIFLIRVSLECVAAALAAYRISPGQARQLRDQANVSPASFTDLSSQDDWDAQIHRTIWGIAGEPMLTTFLEKFISPAMKLSQEAFAQPDDRYPSLEELIRIENDPDDPRGHQALINAICRQDPAAARQTMAVHLTGTIGSRDMRDLFSEAVGIRPGSKS